MPPIWVRGEQILHPFTPNAFAKAGDGLPCLRGGHTPARSRHPFQLSRNDGSALRTTAGKHLAAVSGRHSLAEAMDLRSVALVGLIGTQHGIHLLNIICSTALAPVRGAAASRCKSLRRLIRPTLYPEPGGKVNIKFPEPEKLWSDNAGTTKYSGRSGRETGRRRLRRPGRRFYRFQMLSTYSRTARSAEKMPDFAVFTSIMRLKRARSP